MFAYTLPQPNAESSATATFWAEAAQYDSSDSPVLHPESDLAPRPLWGAIAAGAAEPRKPLELGLRCKTGNAFAKQAFAATAI
jgi:hypothetical protein